MSKCEELKIEHAWREQQEFYGFQLTYAATCANCGLKKTRHSRTTEWWSYSDGREDEPIINIMPV